MPRIEALSVQNYRALRKLELKDITPLTVLLGPNGSGKSTVFDVFAFLAECFSSGLRRAWDKRGRFRELRSRGADGPLTALRALTRIAVEELEAWFFGDPAAVAKTYPGFPAGIASRRGFRDPDAISGGTWEALERELQKAGHFKGGFPKIQVAREIAPNMDPAKNRSASFNASEKACWPFDEVGIGGTIPGIPSAEA